MNQITEEQKQWDKEFRDATIRYAHSIGDFRTDNERLCDIKHDYYYTEENGNRKIAELLAGPEVISTHDDGGSPVLISRDTLIESIKQRIMPNEFFTNPDIPLPHLGD